MHTSTYEEENPQVVSDLPDGVYRTTLTKEAVAYDMGQFYSIEEDAQGIIIDASFKTTDDLSDFDAVYTDIDRQTLFFACEEGVTVYRAGGGEADYEYFSKDEFIDYVNQCIDSGLGLDIEIKDGVVVYFEIFS